MTLVGTGEIQRRLTVLQEEDILELQVIEEPEMQ
jgi:hypothetical protein